MRAVYFEHTGDPLEVLRYGEMPAPAQRPDHARVRVGQRTIQPADLAFIRGRYRIQPAFPQPAGLEGMGVIVQAPAGSGYATGDRVAFRAAGAWADEVEVQLNRLIAVPDDIDADTACQIALNPITAWALLEQSGAREGDTLLLTAGASTVSNLIASLARGIGVRTIGIVRGTAAPRDRAQADELVSANDPALADRIKAASQGRRIAALVDSVGGPQLATLLPILAPGGRIISYGVMDQTPAPISNAMMIYGNLTWIGFGVDRWLDALDAEQRDAVMRALWSAVRKGDLHLPVAARFPLAEFAAALRADAGPGRTGKIILT